MAGEIQFSFVTSKVTYALVRNTNALIYSPAFGGFSGYSSPLYSGYAIPCTEQGASAYYVGNFPSVSPGVYNVVSKQAVTGVPLESDPTTDEGEIEWGGSGVVPLVNIAASGIPETIQLRRSWMVRNYPVYLRSSADNVNPFVSGSVSGMVSQDGGNAVSLQSGSFTPVIGIPGLYNLQSLTSGDLNAGTITLLFQGTISGGGVSSPLVQSFVLQNQSGS
jgi:hypothetical protein